MATAWAANHFVALIPVLQEDRGYSTTLLAAVFGLYAVGLLPGLLLGGAVSDRVGRARLALPGAVVAATGSLILVTWDNPAGLSVGRVVVGLGAGATFSAGSAWMADLSGAAGATLAGVALTSGFGGGPVVSGLLAATAPAPLVTPYVVSICLSVAAGTAGLLLRAWGCGHETALSPLSARGATPVFPTLLVTQRNHDYAVRVIEIAGVIDGK